MPNTSGSGSGPVCYPVHGQALVEFALVFPLLLTMAGAAIDGGRLMVQKADQDHRTVVVADWAAMHPGDDSWQSLAAAELSDCAVTVDATGRPGLVHVGATCHFDPIALHGLWDGLPVSSEADAVVPAPTATPTPSGTPEPSVAP